MIECLPIMVRVSSMNMATTSDVQREAWSLLWILLRSCLTIVIVKRVNIVPALLNQFRIKRRYQNTIAPPVTTEMKVIVAVLHICAYNLCAINIIPCTTIKDYNWPILPIGLLSIQTLRYASSPSLIQYCINAPRTDTVHSNPISRPLCCYIQHPSPFLKAHINGMSASDHSSEA